MAPYGIDAWWNDPDPEWHVTRAVIVAVAAILSIAVICSLLQ